MISCASQSEYKKPKIVLTGKEVTNHTSIIYLPALEYANRDTFCSFLAVQYNVQKPLVKELIEAWFKGLVIENIDANKLIKLKCYRVNKELYKIANKDFTCTSKQRDSIINTLNSRLLVELWYMNGKVLSKVYDSTVMQTYGIKY